MFEIKEGDWRQAIQFLREDKQKLTAIMGGINLHALSEEDATEICTVAKFLVHLDENARIIEKRESPDIIATCFGQTVGIEHTVIVDDKMQRIVNPLKRLFDNAAKLFEEKHPDIKLLANFWLNGRINIKPAERKKTIRQIADFVYGIITKANPDKPEFITEYQITKHSGVSFNYNSGGFSIGDLTEALLLEAILKKDEKVADYLSKSGIGKQWLLIVIGNSSPASFEFEDLQIKTTVQTKFERIYVLEDFNNRIFRIV